MAANNQSRPLRRHQFSSQPSLPTVQASYMPLAGGQPVTTFSFGNGVARPEPVSPFANKSAAASDARQRPVSSLAGSTNVVPQALVIPHPPVPSGAVSPTAARSLSTVTSPVSPRRTAAPATTATTTERSLPSPWSPQALSPTIKPDDPEQVASLKFSLQRAEERAGAYEEV
jgi:hypothetical protein